MKFPSFMEAIAAAKKKKDDWTLQEMLSDQTLAGTSNLLMADILSGVQISPQVLQAVLVGYVEQATPAQAELIKDVVRSPEGLETFAFFLTSIEQNGFPWERMLLQEVFQSSVVAGTQEEGSHPQSVCLERAAVVVEQLQKWKTE